MYLQVTRYIISTTNQIFRGILLKKVVKVVAAIIENENGEILCALRSPQMAIPNMWEFPGGKVEKDEDLFSALEREIDEELQCQINALELMNDHSHEYDTFIINLLAIRCEIIIGTPIANELSKSYG